MEEVLIKGLREKKEERKEGKRVFQKNYGRGDKLEGCFKYGKPGHFAAECYSGGSRTEP